jgi:hypothetical protein
MAKTGPKGPTTQIDKEKFEKLCGLFCTCEDIAEFFDCSVDTIDRFCKREYGANFAEVYKKKSGQGRLSLRRKQYEMAMTGNITMLIWLGKQHLGQRDKQDIEHSGNVELAAKIAEARKRIADGE